MSGPTIFSVSAPQLSATFFRSKYSKLFYMIRMLKSALPRTEPFLNALLREHIICFVPENRRNWQLVYQPVALPPAALTLYNAMIDTFLRSGGKRFCVCAAGWPFACGPTVESAGDTGHWKSERMVRSWPGLL